MVETLQIMRQKADTVAGVVKNISTIEDPNVALLYANSRLVAWRHNLFHKCFKNTLNMPSNWTNAQAAEFFASVLKAIEEDMDTLAKKGDE